MGAIPNRFDSCTLRLRSPKRATADKVRLSMWRRRDSLVTTGLLLITLSTRQYNPPPLPNWHLFFLYLVLFLQLWDYSLGDNHNSLARPRQLQLFSRHF